MSKYEIIIYWSEEDEAFIAEVPELAGCMADGATYQEALANAEIIIRRMDRNGEGFGQTNSRTERQIGFCIMKYVAIPKFQKLKSKMPSLKTTLRS